eukprot:TRINITY_DN7095_c0_g1_i1.p2 TRINITY_DN7095_c0_g1~~TRINITY_DN7095_c0_g1_i1.p2  ORF type:complete len:129 (-),score=0.86 TRINITY_DN7095_c0_g1_i1:23-409(-)
MFQQSYGMEWVIHVVFLESQMIVNFLRKFYSNTLNVLTDGQYGGDRSRVVQKILIGRLKQLLQYLFDRDHWQEDQKRILRMQVDQISSQEFLELICEIIQYKWKLQYSSCCSIQHYMQNLTQKVTVPT